MATITDFSQYAHDGTTYGTASIVPGGKFSNCLYIPENYSASGNGTNGITMSGSTDWNLGSGSFSIDFWINIPSFANYGGGATNVVGQKTDGSNFWGVSVYVDGRVEFYSLTGGGWDVNFYSNISALSANTWYHMAVVRNGNTWYAFINGTSLGLNLALGSYSSAVYNAPTSTLLKVPTQATWNEHIFMIDELRISKGIARWTASFTPPSSPY